MASQTAYYGKLEMPAIGGGKLVVACGKVKFTSSASVATLPVPMRNQVIYVGLSHLNKVGKWTSGCLSRRSVIPWSSGVISAGSILIQRKTGSASGNTLWFEAVGW